MAVLRRIGSGGYRPRRELQPDMEFVEASLAAGKAKSSSDDASSEPESEATTDMSPTLAEEIGPEPQPLAPLLDEPESLIFGEDAEHVVIPSDFESVESETNPAPATAQELAEAAFEEESVDDPTSAEERSPVAAELAALRERAAELEASLQDGGEADNAGPIELGVDSVAASIRSRLDVDVDRRLNYERELTAEAAAARREFEASRIEAEKAESALDTAEDGRRSILEAKIDSLRTELEEAEAELGGVIERQAPLWADFAKAMQRQSRAASRLTVIQQTIGENRRQAEQLRAKIADEANPGARWLSD